MNKETKRKRSFMTILIVILGFCIIVGIVISYFLKQEKASKEINSLLDSNVVLSVSYGVVPQEEKLKEKNALFKRVEQENNYYLMINENNVLFTYYLKWYYTFDPLKGYILTQRVNLTDEQKNAIFDNIDKKKVKNLLAKIEDDYVSIRFKDENCYISKNDLYRILSDAGLELTVYKENTELG